MLNGREQATYRESRPFVPPPFGWLALIGTLTILGLAVFNALRGRLDMLLSLPGLAASVAIGLIAVLARLNVDVYPARVVVGSTARLSRSIPFPVVLSVDVRSSPPPRYTLTWPLARRRTYTIREEGGVELALADGEIVFLGSANPWALAAAMRNVAPHLTVGGDSLDPSTPASSKMQARHGQD